MKFVRHTLAALAALAVTSFISSAFAHAVLKQTVPEKAATLTATPLQMRLQFNEPLEAAFTSIKLVGPRGDVPTDKATLDVSDPSLVLMPLPTLPRGAYKTQWTTMGHDGHRVKGEFAFTVK